MLEKVVQEIEGFIAVLVGKVGDYGCEVRGEGEEWFAAETSSG